MDQKPKDKGIAIGMPGVTTTRLNPMGRVRFDNGEEAEVHSLDGLIESRRHVRVAEIEEEKIFVKLVKEEK